MVFREEATSALAGFHAGLLSWSNFEFGDVGFCEGRKTGEPKEKLSEQVESQQQTQPTCGTTLNQTWATLLGGEGSHQCTIPAHIGCSAIMNK